MLDGNIVSSTTAVAYSGKGPRLKFSVLCVHHVPTLSLHSVMAYGQNGGLVYSPRKNPQRRKRYSHASDKHPVPVRKCDTQSLLSTVLEAYLSVFINDIYDSLDCWKPQ